MDKVEKFLNKKMCFIKQRLTKLKLMEGKTKTHKHTAKLNVKLFSYENELIAYTEELLKRKKKKMPESYTIYRLYRRGKNRCLECGMKIDDKKHCGGNHKQILINMFKHYYEPITMPFEEKDYYKLFFKPENVGKGYYYDVAIPS